MLKTTQSTSPDNQLYEAIQANKIDALKNLLEKGYSLQQRDSRGQTSLHWAAQTGQVAIGELLLQEGTEVDVMDLDGRTPLHVAAMQGHEGFVNFLLQHDANRLQVTHTGETALHYAAQYGQVGIMQLVLETMTTSAKVQFIKQGDSVGKTALHQAAQHADPTGILYLLKQGADINAQNQHGYTALHFAARAGHLEGVKALLSQGADMNLETIDKLQAANIAWRFGHAPVVAWLVIIKEQKTRNGIDKNTFLQHYREILIKYHVKLVDRYLNEGQLMKVIEQYQQLVQLVPENTLYHHNLACYYHVANQLKLAEQHFQQALSLQPTTSTYAEYANFLYQQRRFDEALPLLEQALAGGEDGSGLGYGQLEKPTLDNTLQTLLDCQPSFAISAFSFAYRLKVLSHLALHQPSLATQTLEKWTATLAGKSDALTDCFAADSYYRLGDTLKAATWFERAVLRDSKMTFAQQQLLIALQPLATTLRKPPSLDLFSLRYRDQVQLGEMARNNNQLKAAEDFFKVALHSAEQLGVYPAQVYCIEQIASVYLQQNQYAMAAKWYVAAYALHQQQPHSLANRTLQQVMSDNNTVSSNDSTQRLLFPAILFHYEFTVKAHAEQLEKQLQAIENAFLKGKSVGNYKKDKKPSNSKQMVKTVFAHREQLAKNRLQIPQAAIADPTATIQTILKTFTQSMQRLVTDLLEQCITQLGKSPGKGEATFGALGSMSREEMSPYSDLEFVVLIEKDKPKYRTYYQHLVQLLELKMIALGETPRFSFDPIIQSGFNFDAGGNTPLAAKDTVGVEWIQTPEQLARLQSPENWLKIGEIGRTALQSVGYLWGSETLLKTYEKELTTLFNQPYQGHDPWTNKPLTTKTLGEYYGWWFIRDTVVGSEFEPQLDKRKEQDGFFVIKKELYRLPTNVLAGLALFKQCHAIKNSWARLEALCQQGALSQASQTYLQKVLEDVMWLRVQAHLHYGQEKEDIYPPSIKEKRPVAQDVYVLNVHEIQTLFKVYQTILPLHKITKQFCEQYSHGEGHDPFPEALLYDDSLLTQGQAHEELLQYTKAHECYQQAVAIDPEQGKALLFLGDMLQKLGNVTEAKARYEKALSVQIHRYGADSAQVATCLSSLGEAYSTLGDAQQAITYFEQALVIRRKVYDEQHPDVATSLNNLGAAYQALGDAQQAITYHEQALAIERKVYGEQHPSVATYLNNLGEAYRALGDAKQAITYYEQALAIERKVYGEQHPSVAISLNNLGLAYRDLGDAQQAITYHEQALAIECKVYDEQHPNVARSLNNLGAAHQTLGDAKQAIICFEQALVIWRKVYGEQHPNMAISFNNLGVAHRTLGDAQQAITYHEQALAIERKVYGEQHPSVARSLNNLGSAHQTLGDAKQATTYYEQALVIWRKVYGEQHSNVATSLDNLGVVYEFLGDAKQAIIHYEQALAIWRKVYGEQHPVVAASLNNLGGTYRILGDAKQAITYHEQALAIRRKVYDEQHSDVAMSLNSLGLAYRDLGDAQQAITYHEQALAIERKVYGEQHPSVARSLNNLGTAHQTLGDAKQAITYIEQALKIFKALPNYGENHPSTLTVKESLDALLAQQITLPTSSSSSNENSSITMETMTSNPSVMKQSPSPATTAPTSAFFQPVSHPTSNKNPNKLQTRIGLFEQHDQTVKQTHWLNQLHFFKTRLKKVLQTYPHWEITLAEATLQLTCLVEKTSASLSQISSPLLQLHQALLPCLKALDLSEKAIQIKELTLTITFKTQEQGNQLFELCEQAGLTQTQVSHSNRMEMS